MSTTKTIVRAVALVTSVVTACLATGRASFLGGKKQADKKERKRKDQLDASVNSMDKKIRSEKE